MADYVALAKPGQSFGHTTSAAVTAGQVLVVSATNTVAASSAASHACVGVAEFDAASGTKVTAARGGIQLLVASGAITAGDDVEAAAAGKVATHTDGTADVNIIGFALNTAADAGSVRVVWTK